MNTATATTIRHELSGMTRGQKLAHLESKAKALLTDVVGRPCVSATIGEVLVTEWLTAGDAELAARFFGEIGKAVRLSYDADLGWCVEAWEVVS